MSRAWMPIYWGDYFSDTLHLDTEQHGAYLLLIGHYWQTGKPISANAELLQVICRCKTSAQWLHIWSVIKDFFVEVDNVLVHKRIEAELEKSKIITDKRRNAAMQKHAKKSSANAGANAHANVLQMQVQMHTQSQSQYKPPIVPHGDSAFDLFWNRYPKKKSKGQALKAWNKLHPSNGLCEKINAAVERFKSSPEWLKDGGQYIPYPASWLNARGWEDEVFSPITAERPGGVAL